MSTHIFDNTTHFGTLSRLFHWIMAFLILSIWTVGFSLSNGFIAPESKKDLVSLHKSLGLIILGIAVLRIFWRFSNTSPSSLHFPTLSKLLSKLNTWLFYALMLIFPSSGIVMSMMAGRSLSVFGLTLMDPLSLTSRSPEVGRLAWQLHAICGKLFIVAFGLHITGTLYHQFVLKDHLLKRMIGSHE